MRAPRTLRTLLPFLGVGVLLLVALIVLGDQLGHHIRALDTWIAGLGPWGPLAFLALVVVATSLFVPETLLGVMAGALFGTTRGLMLVVVGGVMSAALQYALARWAFQGVIDRTLGTRPGLVRLRRAVRREELRLQLLIRLTPLNPATLNYVLGATGVRFPGFLLASLAFFPHQLVEVTFGSASRHVVGIAGSGASGPSIHAAAVIAAFVLSVVALIAITGIARRALAKAMSAAAACDET